MCSTRASSHSPWSVGLLDLLHNLVCYHGCMPSIGLPDSSRNLVCDQGCTPALTSHSADCIQCPIYHREW